LLDRPAELTERPEEAAMDVLSDVLLSVRLTGAVFFDVDAHAPFATESPGVGEIGSQVLPGAEHVISFHIVTDGSCWAEAVDHSAPPVPLRAGDIVVFPAGNANIIASSPGMRGRPNPAQYYRPADRTLPFSLATAREPHAAHTRFVCGFLGCDTRPFNPLLDALPRIVHVPISAESRRWLDSLVGIAVQASGGEGAGREAMLSKLAELMFVEAIRSYLDRLPADARDWLAGVRDPQVGAALRVLHGRPAHAWTAERLAREVGMSRSSFAHRFTAYVGIPPMHYLGRWRLQLAARLLETRSVSVGQAAAAVGYQSEAAFNRAFKRAVGQAPGAWRRGRERRPD
jgi:AraC-like DNA-binding protein